MAQKWASMSYEGGLYDIETPFYDIETGLYGIELAL